MRSVRARWRTAAALLALVGLIWWLRTEVVDTVSVTSDSMSPTVCAGDRLVILRAGADTAAGVGDLVTFRDPVEGASTLKRVVAVEGQTVQIADALLYVDGQVVDEPYVDLETIDGTYFGRLTVPEDALFVMGDDREFSIDSRDYGPIPRSSVDGRVLGRVWSDCPS